MSSFRVERQRVSFLSQAEVVRSSTGQPPADSEGSRERMEIAWEKEQTEHAKAYTKQLLASSRKEAEQLLEKARRDADKIRSDAQEKARLLMEQEKQRGFAEGRQESTAAGEQWKAQEIEKLRLLAAQLEEQYQEKVNEVQKDAAELAAEIAEKIIGIRLEETDTVFLNVIDNAMSRFRQSGSITVHLSSEDYQRYSGGESLLQLDGLKGKKVTLEKNESLRKGDCVLETEDQFVDCGIKGQMDRLSGILRETGGEDEGHERDFAEVQGAPAES